MKRTVILMMLMALPAWAAERNEGSPGAYSRSLGCRIAVRTADHGASIRPLVDVNLDTSSGMKTDATFDTMLLSGRKLTAIIQHVYVKMPRDRFNVTMLLDGKPHLRLNHMDLDIFAETTIDGQAYLLHCFRDIPDALLGPE